MSTYLEEHAGQILTADPELAPVGLAVVGAGYWGPNIVRNALQSPATRLAVVCDADISRAHRLAKLVLGRPARPMTCRSCSTIQGSRRSP